MKDRADALTFHLEVEIVFSQIIGGVLRMLNFHFFVWQVVFTFKGEHDPVVIKSNNAYNDDAWHMVELNREASFSKLVIDEKDISDSTHRATVLDVSVPFYVGGIVPDSYNQVETNLVSTVGQY